jgi:3-hydroxybutyryl-CoA dehydrogenase
MGGGIAHVAAACRLQVLLYDVSPDKHREGHRHDQRQHGPPGGLRQADEQAAQGRAGPHPPRRNGRRSPASDLVIEAATEDETVKRKIFAQLCPQLNPEAILATNTSSISITRLAAPPTGRNASSASTS